MMNCTWTLHLHSHKARIASRALLHCLELTQGGDQTLNNTSEQRHEVHTVQAPQSLHIPQPLYHMHDASKGRNFGCGYYGRQVLGFKQSQQRGRHPNRKRLDLQVLAAGAVLGQLQVHGGGIRGFGVCG